MSTWALAIWLIASLLWSRLSWLLGISVLLWTNTWCTLAYRNCLNFTAHTSHAQGKLHLVSHSTCISSLDQELHVEFTAVVFLIYLSLSWASICLLLLYAVSYTLRCDAWLRRLHSYLGRGFWCLSLIDHAVTSKKTNELFANQLPHQACEKI